MLKNNWTFVLIGLVSVFFLIMLISKLNKPKDHTRWRYEIHGYVMYKGKPHDATWFTDTLEFGDNFVKYENSDGTQVVIPSPFILIDHKYDKIKENHKRPFD
jgi:hypothetical protein